MDYGPHMSAFEFRLAVANDARSVSDISRKAYVPAYEPVIGTAPKPAWEDYSQRIADGCVWLAEIGGETAGVLVVEKGPGFLLIYSIAVDPAFQGKGLGLALLGQAEKVAAGMGLDELRLYTNSRMEANIRLYHRAGFHRTGERPHPSRAGEVLTDMSKSIAVP